MLAAIAGLGGTSEMGAGCPVGAMVGIRRSPRPSNTGNQIEQVQNNCKRNMQNQRETLLKKNETILYNETIVHLQFYQRRHLIHTFNDYNTKKTSLHMATHKVWKY